MSLAIRLQLLLALCCLATGHPVALVAASALVALVALRSLARHHLAAPSRGVALAGALPDLAERSAAWPS